MTGGYQNKVLRVDLTNRTFSEEPLDEAMIRDYIGGRGFGIKMLYDDLKPGTDPLGEDNELIFTAGPLAGTNGQSLSRYKVFFKSPLTGGYFKSSSGGQFGAFIKFAGLDVIVIKGKADKPVYLHIDEGKYELRDAEYLWGLDCDDTHLLIREELHDPGLKIACIGPSGERGVKYAGIFSERRAAGRGGAGAVMGFKNLKAIAIKGNKKVELADREAWAKAVKEQINGYRNNPQFDTFSQTGTWIAEATNAMGIFPTKNFREGSVPHWENLESAEYLKTLVRKTRCYSCMVHCGSIAKMHSGKFAGAWTEGPEYETIWAFTGPMRNADLGLTIAADKMCDDLGLDTISTGSTIGFAYELYEKGLITKEDTGGLELVYGNSDAVPELIRQIAYREGIGDLLAEGSREAGRRIGGEAAEMGIQVKGLELPAYDPRGVKSHGLNLLTACIGADHNSGYAPQEVFGSPFPRPVDRLSAEDKGSLTKWNQDSTAFLETGILCSFMPSMGMLADDVFGRMLSSATGYKEFEDVDFLWKVGEKITNLERMFNAREGFGRKDDTFPRRIKEVPLPEGPSAGTIFEEDQMLDDYYTARGWDLKTGNPTKEKLEELGLGFTLK